MSSTFESGEITSGEALIAAAEATAESSNLRERLLAASARASRILLEAPDVMAAMPSVLRELGEAAEVDRTAFAVAETDDRGARWLVIRSEWTAPFVVGARSESIRVALSDRKSDCYCSQLKSGRSVHVTHGAQSGPPSISSELAKSSMIVPFLVDGEYAGAIGFDDCKHARQFDPGLVSALEIAASVVGAALHRERLIETVRIEKERTAEQRVAELAKANAALRVNLERLAGAQDQHDFFGHILLDTCRHMQAVAGLVVMLSVTGDEWRVVANVRDGHLETPPFPTAIPNSDELNEWHRVFREPVQVDLETMDCEKSKWPGVFDYQRREGHKSVYKMPLVFGDNSVGFIILAFRHHEPLSSENIHLLIAIAQQATLAIGLKRLGISAKNAAVLAERNRISQEIHDGLAQAFTGILMQLGAAEDIAKDTPASMVLSRIRDIAREGLAEARRSVFALKPNEGRPGGLELALRQLADRSTVEGRVKGLFIGGGATTGLAPEHEHELLRIAQEAVSNALRHAHPKTVSISLVIDDHYLMLNVVDDGAGMEDLPDQCAQRGFGLNNMRERAQAIGGTWQIRSEPRNGTQISVRLIRPRVI